MSDERREQEHFENEVRRIARARWPSAASGGATLVDGRERDGVFETEDCIHLIEATTSRKLDKARQDVAKLTTHAAKLQKTTFTKVVRCWFVTRDEPTPEQRAAGQRHRPQLTILSFSQFQASLVDAAAYLAARSDYAFGSVRDPFTGHHRVKGDYVPLALVEADEGRNWPVDALLKEIISGRRILLLGDYGAGKSMTLRHLHGLLAQRYRSGQSVCFPVAVNLRDHYGQSDPAEILERHARAIGFRDPSHLVRAWRAGWVYLLLDGFDEITTLTIQGAWRRLRDSRFRAMEPVRRLIASHPPDAGLLLAGRAHFFDSPSERRPALGLDLGTLTLSVSEFGEAETRTYLQSHGLAAAIPAWLPSRPLLVAYLAAAGLLRDVVGEWATGLAPAAGWNLLLDRIAEREASIEAGIDGPTVRRILERLATKARASQDGLGPLGADDIIAAFREVCGYPPDDRGMLLLQRLPGLGVDQAETDARRFVDFEFAEACRAGELVSFARNPYEATGIPGSFECEAGALGIGVAAEGMRKAGLVSGQLQAALERAMSIGNQHLIADLVLSGLEAGLAIGSRVYVKDVLIGEVNLRVALPSAGLVEFQDCFFGEVGIDTEADASALPRFSGCYVALLDGRASEADLPPGIFEACKIENFGAAASTTDAILNLPVAMGVRVLITVLKKLFERRGRGRRENALYRGLDHRARQLVPQVLQLVRAQSMAFPCRMGNETVWLPDRGALARAGRIIASPTSKDDPLVLAAADVD